jgi:hypothetical protein
MLASKNPGKIAVQELAGALNRLSRFVQQPGIV